MSYKLKYKKILISFLIIIICVLFFQDMLIVIAKQPLYIAPILVISLLCLFLLNDCKKNILKIIQLYRQTSFKYLIYFILLAIFSSLFLGLSEFFKCTIRISLIYGLAVIPTIIFANYIFPRYFSYKKLFKVFLFIYIFILIYGIFYYLVQLLHLGVFEITHKMFVTRDLFLAQTEPVTWNMWALISEQKVRAMSVFFEPSFFATFLFLFMPFVYKIVHSNKIFNKNKVAEKQKKILLVTLMWLNLLLTQSPMYIVAGVLYTLVYYSKPIIFRLKKYILPVIISILITLALFITMLTDTNISASNNIVFARITNTINSFGSIEKLVKQEPSLATRLLVNYHGFKVGCQNILTGTGYGNASNYMLNSFVNSKAPLTEEITMVSVVLGHVDAPPAIFFAIFCQTGLIATILLYLYFIKSILQAQKVSKYLYGKEKLLCESLILIAVNYIIISFYWSIDKYPFMWFIFGLLNSYILYYKTIIKKQKLLLQKNQTLLEEK